MPSAIVTGATGILGRAIVHELCDHPEQWTEIYAMSRSKKEDFGPRVKFTHLDLQAEAESMASELKGVQADYVFFAAYLEQPNEVDATRVNGDMLAAFVKALELVGVAKQIKRFVLLCGAKNYGVHLGHVKIPMEETDAWLPEPPFPPNFYYRQQNILHDFCSRHNTEWNVTLCAEVLGHAQGNFMNMGTAVAIYAAISRELGRDLLFPGSEQFYFSVTGFSSATLHAQFCRWMVMEPRAANEAFNLINGDAQSWMGLWPRVATYFGLEVPADMMQRPTPLAAERALPQQPPLSVVADKHGLADTSAAASPSVLRQRINLVRWAQTDEVQNAWKRLVDREGLDSSALDKASWAFTDFVWGRQYNLIQSMTKARKLGWTGYVDSWDNFVELFETLKDEKVIPRN